MTRRDTILISIVINACLLCVLFFTAVSDQPIVPAPHPKVAFEPLPPPPQKVAASVQKVEKVEQDPIDQVLSHYSEVLAKKEAEKELPKVVKAQPLPPPLPSPASQPKAVIGEKVVTVAKGDVLEKIAKVHNTSVEQLMKINNLQSHNLRVGQVLKIPEGKSEAHKVVASETAQPKEQNARYYTVKSGESPWVIAQKHNMQLEQLLRLNNMDPEKARKLRPGDKLRIE